MLGDAKTQTQTHTHKEEEKSAPAARAPLSAAAAAGPSLSERMCEEFRRQRGALYAWTRKDDGAVGALLSLSGGNEAEVERRWRIALAWRGFPECATPGELARNWNHYARAQDAPGAGPKSDRARL